MVPVLLIAIKTPLERKTVGLEKDMHIFGSGRGSVVCERRGVGPICNEKGKK